MNLIDKSEAISNDLLILAQWMAGDFSNYQQASASPKDYAHIHVFFRPLPFEFFSGIGLYSEQVYDYDLWTPYRQGVHRLVECDDHIYIENFSLKNAMFYAGSGRNLDILKTISTDAIERRYNCSMVFKRDGDRFIGGVEGNSCFIEKNGCQTYLDSYVEVTETTWLSLDKGLDVNTHKQVWGSTTGPLRFKKGRALPMKSQLSSKLPEIQLESSEAKMLPPEAQKKMQCWIRSRHLICSGNFFVFESVDYSAIERFGESVSALGGTVISVEPVDKIWMGDHRQVILYRSKASLHTPHHQLKQYWIKYGNFRTRFDDQA